MSSEGPWSNQVRNQVIIGGPNGALYVYSGTPGFGNLIGSITGTAGFDQFGNATLAGEVGYSQAGGTFFATQIGGTGMAASTAFYTASSAAGPYTLQGFIEGSGAGISIQSFNGIVLGTTLPDGTVTITTGAGLSGGAPVSSLDRTVLAAGNNNTATDITTAWTIPAHDADNGAKYTIETFVTATTGATSSQTLTLGLDLNAGTLVPLATLGAAFNGAATATTYGIPVRLTVVPGAGTSASNAQITLSGPLGDTSANRLDVNSANMAGFSNGTAFTTTSSNTIALYAQWGGAGGTGQSAGARWSELTRSGQN